VSKVDDLYNHIENEMTIDPKLNNQLFTELSRIVSSAYNQSMNSDEGYCFKFTLPMTPVNKLYSLLKLDPKEVGNTFQKEWNVPSNATMYNDPYYHILLLIYYYAIKIKNDLLASHALFILLIKLWNGRKSKYIRYCDKRVMNYVVAHMVTNKHLVAKFDSPLSLLKEYFCPTLTATYKDQILREPALKLKQLFMQAWSRINQLFVFNLRINMETGDKEAQGGLLPLYMKAKQENLYLTTTTISKSSDEDEPTFDQYTSIHNRDKIVSDTTDFITMNTKPQYTTRLKFQVR
jgi:hypothetical protein